MFRLEISVLITQLPVLFIKIMYSLEGNHVLSLKDSGIHWL